MPPNYMQEIFKCRVEVWEPQADDGWQSPKHPSCRSSSLALNSVFKRSMVWFTLPTGIVEANTGWMAVCLSGLLVSPKQVYLWYLRNETGHAGGHVGLGWARSCLSVSGLLCLDDVSGYLYVWAWARLLGLGGVLSLCVLSYMSSWCLGLSQFWRGFVSYLFHVQVSNGKEDWDMHCRHHRHQTQQGKRNNVLCALFDDVPNCQMLMSSNFRFFLFPFCEEPE